MSIISRVQFPIDQGITLTSTGSPHKENKNNLPTSRFFKKVIDASTPLDLCEVYQENARQHGERTTINTFLLFLACYGTKGIYSIGKTTLQSGNGTHWNKYIDGKEIFDSELKEGKENHPLSEGVNLFNRWKDATHACHSCIIPSLERKGPDKKIRAPLKGTHLERIFNSTVVLPAALFNRLDSKLEGSNCAEGLRKTTLKQVQASADSLKFPHELLCEWIESANNRLDKIAEEYAKRAENSKNSEESAILKAICERVIPLKKEGLFSSERTAERVNEAVQKFLLALFKKDDTVRTLLSSPLERLSSEQLNELYTRTNKLLLEKRSDSSIDGASKEPSVAPETPLSPSKEQPKRKATDDPLERSSTEPNKKRYSPQKPQKPLKTTPSLFAEELF